MADLKVALWATNLAAPLTGMAAWLEGLERRAAEAVAQGVDLLVLPEYATAHWLCFAPEGLRTQDEIAWLADRAGEVEGDVATVARRHGIGLLAGTAPARSGNGFTNQARLFLPDGTCLRQDKLCLTPFERSADAWLLEPGRELRVFTWRGVRIAIAICLDVELPALAARMSGLEIDLLLVPSMTEKASGHARVFGCAKARAIELFTTVAAVGTVGSLVLPGRTDRNVSGAAFYVPCEEALGSTGRLAEIGAAAEHEDPLGPMLMATVPVELVRRLRRDKAEVWPGAWTADHVDVVPIDAGAESLERAESRKS